MALGLFFAFASGVCNGLFTAPMKIVPRWKWEHIRLALLAAVLICSISAKAGVS